jgi:hypothetical protein
LTHRAGRDASLPFAYIRQGEVIVDVPPSQYFFSAAVKVRGRWPAHVGVVSDEPVQPAPGRELGLVGGDDPVKARHPDITVVAGERFWTLPLEPCPHLLVPAPLKRMAL